LEALPAIETSFVIARSEATKQSSTKKRLPRTEVLAMTQYKQNILTYREWLTELKILDPACGSGAFLNQALEFLIREHTVTRDMLLPFGDLTIGYEIETSILEHNLYGVDINEDAVEIARLSLWLRTAHRGRTLTNLSEKIVCANSLLAMPFDEGSFDVVIGNPPYVKEYTNKNAFDGLRESQYYQGKMDLWYFFGCQALDLIKENGLVGFIAPNNWISNAGASKFRNKVLNDGKILKFIDFGDFKVFEDAGIQTMIYIMGRAIDNEEYKINISKVIDKKISHIEANDFIHKAKNEKFEYFISTINKSKMLDSIINFSNENIEIVLNKIQTQQNFVLEEKEVAQGIVGAPDKAFIIKEKDISKFGENELKYIKRFHTNAGKYWTNIPNKFIIYLSDKNFNTQDIQDYPNLERHFEISKNELIEAKIKYKTPNKKYYYLHRERDESFFKKGSKIICSTRTLNPSNTYTEEEFYGSRALNFIKTDRLNLKFLVCILNSKVANFWLKFKGKMTGDLLQIDKSQLISLPIKNTDNVEPFIKLVDEILEAKQKIKEYKALLDEAVKADNFEREIKLKKEIEAFENRVIECEKEIDKMVYELYGLSEDEIKIVEGV
ncbi:MAG: N-6 DNA methylase, partial [Sulfurimonas sp.]|nr:N-6 DNA methylase [Sulfurimonas sp.]